MHVCGSEKNYCLCINKYIGAKTFSSVCISGRAWVERKWKSFSSAVKMAIWLVYIEEERYNCLKF